MPTQTVTLDELKAIADVLGVKFVQAFILPDGDEIKTSNMTREIKK